MPPKKKPSKVKKRSGPKDIFGISPETYRKASAARQKKFRAKAKVDAKKKVAKEIADYQKKLNKKYGL